MTHESRHLSATAPADLAVEYSSAEPPTRYAYGDAPLLELVDHGKPLAVLAAEKRSRTPATEPFPLPEDRGKAQRSPIGEVEYVEDIIRPGRILVVAAEEGTGKSYLLGELAIRLSLAGGKFAGIWEVLDNGPVLWLSEMHSDDDYAREELILVALDVPRVGLVGGLYRLPVMTAAGSVAALQDEGWCSWITQWLRQTNAKALIVDTATAAANVDPWGPEIQAVYRRLRAMQETYPDLAIVLAVHLKKPSGRGERRLSDVLGEWGRWSDVVLLLENDGASLERVKVTARKRVRQERRFIATKRDGLLVDPEDIAVGGAPKVPLADVVAAITASPGIDGKMLGKQLGVSAKTAQRYAAAAEEAGQVSHAATGSRGAFRYFPAEEGEAEMLVQLQMTGTPGQTET